MIKRLIKNFFIKSSELKFVSGITKKLRTGVIALCYHGVENDIFDQRIQELHLPFAAFEKQIEFLGRNYEFISTDYLYDCIKYSYKINPKQILLTFDDGFKNISSLVAPYLNSLKKPFAVFISTRHISEGLRYPTYYLRTSIHFTEKKRIDMSPPFCS